MQTLPRILERAGGYRPTHYLKIENLPYMALVIEATPEPGPLGFPAISVARYGKQNGDLMLTRRCVSSYRRPSGVTSLLTLITGATTTWVPSSGPGTS